jgi:hypothetical protein
MIIDLSFAEKNYEPKGDVEEKQIKSNAKDKFSQKLKNISEMLDRDYTLNVGWFSGNKYNNGLEVGDVAKLQEYGGVGENGNNIPPRPFVRPAMAENSNKWRKNILKNIKNEISKGHVAFLNNIFKELGKEVKENIQKSIQDVYEPPLADYTIMKRMEKRGMSDFSILENMQKELTKPLIDTGKMLKSCDYKVSSK